MELEDIMLSEISQTNAACSHSLAEGKKSIL
jgi:hypothetical protein